MSEPGYPGSVVSDFESKQVVKAFCFNIDMTSRRARCDRMLDGVFHHRLQNKMGNLGRKRLRFQFKRHRQPISEADLFDLKIAADEFSLLFEVDQLLVGIFEG